MANSGTKKAQENDKAYKESIGVIWRKHKYKYMMIAPFAIIFIIFTLLPVLVAIFLSFTTFNMVEAPEFT